MSIREELLHRLADGEVHSGADLAAELDRSRTAVWKQLQRLRSLGLELQPDFFSASLRDQVRLLISRK